jgi:hypothetical protein
MKLAISKYDRKPQTVNDQAKSILATGFEPGESVSVPVDIKAPQIVLSDGRSFYVTNDRKKWESLAEAGEIVFSGQELLRLQAACATSTDTEAREIRDKVLLMKETFSYSYVRRGVAA